MQRCILRTRILIVCDWLRSLLRCSRFSLWLESRLCCLLWSRFCRRDFCRGFCHGFCHGFFEGFRSGLRSFGFLQYSLEFEVAISIERSRDFENEDMLHTATGSGEKASEMSSSKTKEEESISDKIFGILSDRRSCCYFAPTEGILGQPSLMRVLLSCEGSAIRRLGLDRVHVRHANSTTVSLATLGLWRRIELL